MARILSNLVEVIVFRKKVEGFQYLLLKRSSKEELYPDLWQVITGSVNRKELSVKAALRELNEETGLFAKRFWIVPFIDSYFNRSIDTIQLVPVFAVEIGNNQRIQLSSEHQCYSWMRYSEARKRLVWPGQRNALEVVHHYISQKQRAAQLLEIKSIQ